MVNNEVSLSIQKGFFHPICNPTEIERVFNVQNAQDYILKIRAETIVDHMRLFRVYRNKALAKGNSWSLENSFSNSHYERFISHLSKANKERCHEVSYGNIFSNQATGSIFKSPYGPIINISDSLNFFLKFMNLGILNFKNDIPDRVRFNAIRIAIRVMLQTEALDFYMDPRGIVPKQVGIEMERSIPNELLFIAGHEFSHHLADHLSDQNISEKSIIRAIFEDETDYKPVPSYNQSQAEEFEADVLSIEVPKYSKRMKTNVLEGALSWFAKLIIYEHFIITAVPSRKNINLEHPSANDRYDFLLNTVELPPNFNKSYWENFKERLADVKSFIEYEVQNNITHYRFYGSVYLDEPNTEWRGKELIDRKDYY